MKLIVVGIDFSKTSIHALKYSIFLANKAEADVIMVWVDNQTTSESIFSDGGAELREEIKTNFEDLINLYKPELKKGTLTYKLKKGKVYFEIAQLAKQYDADLVVVGTHGVTGYEEFWIGSNAYRTVTNAPCPVVSVRQQFDFSGSMKNIVLPIDNTPQTLQKVPATAQIAKLFNATVHVLALYSTSIHTLQNKVDKTAEKVFQELRGSGIKCRKKSLMGTNITQATIEYANKVNAEMIAIMTEQETTVSNILLGEYAQQMVNNSSVPVLSVHPKEVSGTLNH